MANAPQPDAPEPDHTCRECGRTDAKPPVRDDGRICPKCHAPPGKAERLKTLPTSDDLARVLLMRCGECGHTWKTPKLTAYPVVDGI